MVTSLVVRPELLLGGVVSEVRHAAAEVDQLGRQQRVDHHVLRLEVPVRDLLGEEEAQALGDLVGELQLGLDAEGPAGGDERVHVLLVGRHVDGVALVPVLLHHQVVPRDEGVRHVPHVLQEGQLVLERVYRRLRLRVADFVRQPPFFLFSVRLVLVLFNLIANSAGVDSFGYVILKYFEIDLGVGSLFFGVFLFSLLCYFFGRFDLDDSV